MDYVSIKEACKDSFKFLIKRTKLEIILIALLLFSTWLNFYQREYIKALKNELYKCYSSQFKTLKQIDGMDRKLDFIRFFIDADYKYKKNF